MTPTDNDNKTRCRWAQSGNALYLHYHDHEWGVPLHDDHCLFEFLILEGAQAGLSWATVLNKRENYRRAFGKFDPQKIARFSDKKINTLLQDAGLIRNKLKMNAAVTNARCFIETAHEFGDFNSYLWQFVGGKPLQGKHSNATTSVEAKALSTDLRKRGFKFVGETIMYAYMQATGMINDHDKNCFRRRPCAAMK